jgi:hypothetical protein
MHLIPIPMEWTPHPQRHWVCQSGSVKPPLSREERHHADYDSWHRSGKAVFQVHGVDAHAKTALKKQLERTQVAEFFANLSPCLIGMEACGSAHYWARKLQGFGHTVRLMAPQFVKLNRPGKPGRFTAAPAAAEHLLRARGRHHGDAAAARRLGETLLPVRWEAAGYSSNAEYPPRGRVLHR